MKNGVDQLKKKTWMLGLGKNNQGSVFDYLEGFTFLSCVYIMLGRQTQSPVPRGVRMAIALLN